MTHVLLLLLLLLVPHLAWAQPGPSGAATIQTDAKGATPTGRPTSSSIDANTQALDVNVRAGGGTGGTSSNFGAAEPGAGTAVGARDTLGNLQPIQLDGSGVGQNLNVNCKAGCAAAGDSTSGSQAINLGTGNGSTYPNGPAPSGLILSGDRGASFLLAAGGTLIATLTPQCSPDGGTTYFNAYFQDPFTGVTSTTTTIASGQAATSLQVMCPQGSSHAQLKATSFTSGTANFTGRATVVTWPSIDWGVVTTGAPTYTTGQIAP